MKQLSFDKIRLKWKIFLFLIGFCSLLLLILWLFQTVFLNDMYKFVRQRELRQVIVDVAREITDLVPDTIVVPGNIEVAPNNIDTPENIVAPDNDTALYEMLSRIQNEHDIFIVPTHDFVPPPAPEFDPRGRVSALERFFIIETKEFRLQNGEALSLTFYALVVPVNATVSTLHMQLYFITGVMLLFSIFLAIFIAKRIATPIENISQGAQKLAKGNYDTRFSGRGFREIVALSDTLNTAALDLGKVEGFRRELMANVSHDLRTPLALIYSYAEMMHDFPGEITNEQISVLMSETQRLTTLVNDMLNISKLENEMEQLHFSRFDLTQSLRETTCRMRELLKNEGFIITFESDGDVYVDADEVKISRAFYNLLTNAVNYSGHSRSVTIRQTISDQHVRISISDEGEGVAESDLPFIWDRYYKSGNAHKRGVTGTGLGLSIVKKIIELHDGRYGVTSEISKGSVFWFELPVCQ